MRDDVFLEAIEELLPLGSGDSALFEFTAPITAELVNYDIICYAIKSTGQLEEVKRANDVVAGDIFYINGQSNAEAGTIMDDLDKDPFLRGIKSDGNWSDLKFAKPGKWGGRIAKRILDDQQIPVCIINKAVGGKPLKFYTPGFDEETPNNYDQVKTFLKENDLFGKVRAALWYQGETDGWEASIESYKTDFLSLANAWIDDYKLEHIFQYQLRFQSCTHIRPFVLEAQRQSAIDHPKVEIMSVSNAAHDSCHFEYIGGYQDLGDRMFEQIKNRFYDGNNLDAPSPDIVKANRFYDNQIILELGPMGSNVVVEGSPWADFIIDSTDVIVTGGHVDDVDRKKLVLQLDKTPPAGELFISYLCHPGAQPDWVYNASGVGLLSAYHIPVLEQDSFTISSTEQLSTLEIEVYPNPTNDFLNIKIPSDLVGEMEIDLLDLQGRSSLSKKYGNDSSHRLDLRTLSGGIYFLNIVVDEKRFTQKIIVNK